MVKVIKEKSINSIAIPPLGSGNGGLDWNKVKCIMEKYLSDLKCDVYTLADRISHSISRQDLGDFMVF